MAKNQLYVCSMNYRSYVAVVVVAATFAVTLSLDAASLLFQTRSTQPLCVTKEWWGGQAMTTGYFVNGRQIVTNSWTLVTYSALKQKILAFQYRPVRKYELFDYPGETLYVYDSPYNGTCEKFSLPGPFQEQCLPGNITITFDPHTSFGAGLYSTYGWEARGTLEGNITYHVTMTSDMVPMLEEFYGTKDGVPFFQNLYFYNASRVNLDPSVFRVPDCCRGAQ